MLCDYSLFHSTENIKQSRIVVSILISTEYNKCYIHTKKLDLKLDNVKYVQSSQYL